MDRNRNLPSDSQVRVTDETSRPDNTVINVNNGASGNSSDKRGRRSGDRHAHFARNETGGRGGRGRFYQMPDHVYNKYIDAAEAHRQAPRPDYDETDASTYGPEEVTTLYIPKYKSTDGGKTLMRRRKHSSKRSSSRSSSKRKNDYEPIDDLLRDEDNHLLPSLRIQRRARMKTLKDRKSDLIDEHRLEQEEEGLSFGDRFHDLRERDDVTIGHLAGIIRDSTIPRVKRLDFTQPERKSRIKRRWRDLTHPFQLWDSSFKVIEGKFGTAVMTFFKFIRWLLFLNIFMMIIMFFVITVPYLALKPHEFNESVDTSETQFTSLAVNCTQNYTDYVKEFRDQENNFEKVIDFLLGTGWMERTVLFYGIYHNTTYNNHDGDVQTYNMGFAYILAVGACFLVSFLLLLRNSAKSVKATFGMQTAVATFSNRVFAGWDYAIANEKAARVKKENLLVEYRALVFEEIRRKKMEQRTTNDEVTIFGYRFLVNLIVVILLGGSLFLIYYMTDKLLELQKEDLHEIVQLIVQYSPYLTITVLNFAIPLIFQKIVVYEDYKSSTTLWVTLARSVLLRLASLMVLMVSLYRQLIINTEGEEEFCGNRLWSSSTASRGSIKCWETYVGQQLYKLVLLDIIVETSIIVFMQLPRRLLYNAYGEKFGIIKKIGMTEFDLPQNVIDIIYSQTLCWLGMVFSPLIPFMTFLKCLIFFYLRKWTLLKNCAHTQLHFGTARSHSLFMFVLLFSFMLTTLPIGYMVSGISPSQSCGPFRVYSSPEFTIFDALSNVVRTWPSTLRDIILFLGTIGFLLPLIIILCFLIYSFWLLGQGYKKREKILNKQLKMEAKDKQFLLTRVNEVLISADSG